MAAALVRDNLDGGVKQWRLAVMQPSAVQGGPFAALAHALTSKTDALPELLGGIGALYTRRSRKFTI